MTVYIRPSMAERSIGSALWRWREDTGMSLAEACEKAGFSVATLSMMENSLRPFDPLNIMILGRVYDIPNETWKHEVRRAELATRARAQARTKKSSSELNATRDLDEAYLEATTICTFGADMIPRLFQTPEYRIAATALGCPTHEDDDAALRAERHTSWINDLAIDAVSSPTVDVVVTKRAIHQIVANQATTSASLVQLVHLSELDHFTVQVLDDEALPDIQPENSYCHLTFPHVQHNDVVYLENAGHGRYIEDAATCRLIRNGFKAIQRCALSPARSVEVIAEAASSLKSRTPHRKINRKPRAKIVRSIARTGK